MRNPSKGLFIINLILLCKTFCNKTSFVALNGPIRMSLNLVDPLITNNRFPGERVTKSQVWFLDNASSFSFIAICHKRVSGSFTIGVRLV